MTLREMAERLGLALLTPEIAERADRDARLGHVSDLLSDVLANAPAGSVLVTIQTHLNVIAVAVNAEVAAVVFAWDRRPDEPARRKAAEEGILLYGSPASAFEIVGRLHALGVRGGSRDA